MERLPPGVLTMAGSMGNQPGSLRKAAEHAGARGERSHRENHDTAPELYVLGEAVTQRVWARTG